MQLFHAASYEVQCTKMSHFTFTILQLGRIKTAFSTSQMNKKQAVFFATRQKTLWVL